MEALILSAAQKLVRAGHGMGGRTQPASLTELLQEAQLERWGGCTRPDRGRGFRIATSCYGWFGAWSPGTEGPRGPNRPDRFLPAGTPERPEATLSPMSVDSAISADTTLDTTGDITVEDVQDFLG